MTLTADLPLTTVLQQCNDNEHLNPTKDYNLWVECLQEVYETRTTKPTAAEFGDAIYSVWNVNLTRNIFSTALLGITPSYNQLDVYTNVNKYYPITITIIVDTDLTIQTNCAQVSVIDDNGDPNQGCNELAVNAKLGNTIIWKAISKSGGDTINLIEFMVRGGNQLFSNGEPAKQGDGTWKGTLTTVGEEVYAFNLTINASLVVYTWDPYIYCTQ